VASITISFLGIGLAYFVHPWLITTSLAGVAATYVSGVLLKRNPLLRSRPNKNPDRITDAQVYALIDSRRPSVTASRLALATNSTEEAASLKLRDLAGQGTLVIEQQSSTTELVFQRTPTEMIDGN